jgi:hypothetical protein
MGICVAPRPGVAGIPRTPTRTALSEETGIASWVFSLWARGCMRNQLGLGVAPRQRGGVVRVSEAAGAA